MFFPTCVFVCTSFSSLISHLLVPVDVQGFGLRYITGYRDPAVVNVDGGRDGRFSCSLSGHDSACEMPKLSISERRIQPPPPPSNSLIPAGSVFRWNITSSLPWVAFFVMPCGWIAKDFLSNDFQKEWKRCRRLYINEVSFLWSFDFSGCHCFSTCLRSRLNKVLLWQNDVISAFSLSIISTGHLKRYSRCSFIMTLLITFSVREEPHGIFFSIENNFETNRQNMHQRFSCDISFISLSLLDHVRGHHHFVALREHFTFGTFVELVIVDAELV